MRVHGQLMNVDGDVIDTIQHFALIVQDRQVAHSVAGVDTIAVGGNAQRHDVRPFIQIVAFGVENLNAVLTIRVGMIAVLGDLAGHGHV